MFSINLPLLLAGPPAAAAEGAAGGATGGIITFLPFILIIAIFYFLIIRPQNKKQKETQKMLDNLKKGDKIVTIGGIHGIISSVKDKSVVVKVDDTTKIEFSRSAIAAVTDAQKTEDIFKDEEKTEGKTGGASTEK
ncbi:MAG: preprotein translocase subunit YajC [Spirochaetaceae bacterium]|nr:preprotein translocase subunit YajC [Spirochaetaceae bacterium]